MDEVRVYCEELKPLELLNNSIFIRGAGIPFVSRAKSGYFSSLLDESESAKRYVRDLVEASIPFGLGVRFVHSEKDCWDNKIYWYILESKEGVKGL